MKRVTFSIPWPFDAAETRSVFAFAFQTALLSFLGFSLIESFRTGFVTLYLNLDWWLWATAITGVLSTIWPAIVSGAKRHRQQPTWLEYVWIGMLVFLSVLAVWYKMATVGWLVRFIAPLSGLVVLGLCLLIFYDRDDEPDQR